MNFNTYQNNVPKIDPTKFYNVAKKIDDNFLQQMVSDARAKGISEQDIVKGLEFIKQLKTS